MKTTEYNNNKADITSALDTNNNPNYSKTNKQWFQESELADQIKQDTKWVNVLNPDFTLNQRIILIRDNIKDFKECLICKTKIKFAQQLHKTSDYCSKSCVTKSTLSNRVLKRRENSKEKKCINYRLLKYKLECYDYKLKNNKPYNKRMYSRLLANYLWNEYKNLDLVTKALIKHSKQRIFNIIKTDLSFLITEYEKEYQLNFNSTEIFRILKFEKEPRLCPHCSAKIITDNQFCSVLCSNQYKSTDETYLANLSNAVAEYYKTADKDEIKDRHNKIKTTLLIYNQNIDDIKDRNMIKWGYEYPQLHPDILAKSKQTRLEKYGDENYVNLEQREITNIKKYGDKSALTNEEVRRKIENTIFSIYGVRNIMQTGLFCNSGYRWKEFEMPSGEIVKYQGYENILFDELLLEYSENEIITERKDIPHIWYIGIDGKKHRYFPDVYVPSTNTIYEVKSEYTLNVGLETNNLKFQAVKDAGYNFILKVY